MSDYKPQIPLSDLRYIWSEAAVYAVRTWDGQGNYRQEVRKHFRRYMESAVLSGLQEELSRRAKEIDALRAQLATLQAATPVGLDFPDGPGWWAGKTKGGRQFVVHWTEFDIRDDVLVVRWAEDSFSVTYPINSFKRDYIGTKWYKLHMPWNATNGGQDAKR